jgi:ribosomal protein S18 acetylase RimI-like enzyme
LLAEARGRCESVHLIVSEGNRSAMRLYSRLGFQPVAFEPRGLKLADGAYVNEVLMSRQMT